MAHESYICEYSPRTKFLFTSADTSQALFAEEIYYIWMHWVIKMAFLLFYLRFATTRTFRYLVYGTMGLNTIFSLITWLLYVLQCVPLDAVFHPAAHPTAKCLDRRVLAFVPTAFVSATTPNPGSSIHLTSKTERIRRHSHPNPPHPPALEHPSLAAETPDANQHRLSRQPSSSRLHAPHHRPRLLRKEH
jgi:Fungal rhodopsin domain